MHHFHGGHGDLVPFLLILIVFALAIGRRDSKL